MTAPTAGVPQDEPMSGPVEAGEAEVSVHQHEHPDLYCPKCVEFGAANASREVLKLLAERDARVAGEAWDEGYTSGHSNAMRQMSDEPNAPTTANPYRRADGLRDGGVGE